MAWDQPDNAARVKRLGTGNWLPANSSGDQIAKGLARLMTPETRAQCRVVAAKFGNDDALETAADYLEEFSRHDRHKAAPQW